MLTDSQRNKQRKNALSSTNQPHDCPFCERIAAGDYDSSPQRGCYVFAPLNPVTPGHLLVVPGEHVRDAAAAPATAAAVMQQAALIVRKSGKDANIITSAGAAATQTVPHLHLHVVPRREGDGLALPWTGQRKTATGRSHDLADTTATMQGPVAHESFNVPAAAVIAGAAALRTEMRTGTEDLQDLARAVLEDAGPGRTGPLEARLSALRDAVSQAVNAADDGPKWHAATREEAMTGLGELTAALRDALLADYHAAHGTQGNTGASQGTPRMAAEGSIQPRAEDEPLPAPVFSHHAYDVDVTWLGENGGMAARGHIPDLRFIAACNHLARTEAGLLNIFDDRSIRLDDAIAQINRIWAVPIDPAGSGSDWAIRWGDVTGHTPGAFPLTVMLP